MSNTTFVRHVKDLTSDERETAKLESLAFLSRALENNKRYAIAVLNEDKGTIELNGSMSSNDLLLASKIMALQAVLGTADDPQAVLDQFIADTSDDEEEAA